MFFRPTPPRRIVVVQGHPDTEETHLGHALAEAYAQAAEQAGHHVRHVMVAQLDVPALRSRVDWESGAIPETVLAAQEAIRWAEHLVIVYPLWLGCLPAVLKAFFEQVFRPGFAFDPGSSGWNRRLGGRSARVVVTMSMPAMRYRWWYGAHGLRCFVRNVLRFSGIAPVRTSLVGSVERASQRRWLARMQRWGARAT